MRSHRSSASLLRGVLLAAALIGSTAPLTVRIGAQAPAATASTAAFADLDPLVARVMKTFDVPGIGLAIVKDGKVVVAKGYGVRKMGEPGAVDGQTLFAIASNTKVFTATALGLLVEEGKIEWDAPVIKYVPWFQMWDPYVTREMTVRDLLVHRSGLGLGGGDLLWWPSSTLDRKEIGRRLRFVQPATSFRSAYAYDNVLYLIAGEVIEAVSGQSWEDFVANRVVKPAGMANAHVRLSDLKRAANVASPHAPIDGKVRPIATFDSDNTNPAGGIIAGADDMARWMIVQLDKGRLAGDTRLFSERTSRELTTLVTPMPIGEPPPELAAQRANFRGYALGLNVHDYRGRKVITHTGGLPGYVSKLTLIPELNLGVMVLTNQESGDAFSALTWSIIDRYLGADAAGTGAARMGTASTGGNASPAKAASRASASTSAATATAPATDWIDAYAKVRARADAGIAEAGTRSTAARDTASKPSLPLERYAGTYTDAWYGDIDITHENGKLTMTFSHTPSLSGELEHWQHDTFIARWRDRELRADAYVTFTLDPDGKISEAKMRAVSPATDFSFDFQDLLLRSAKPKPASSSRD